VVLGGEEGKAGRLRRVARTEVLVLETGVKVGLQVGQALDEYVDVLCSAAWPQGVTSNIAPAPLTTRPQSSTAAVSALKATPRFHFAGGEGFFYRRPPYINERTLRVTYFIGLGPFTEASPSSCMYALALTGLQATSREELNALPDETTACPYLIKEKKPKLSSDRSTAPDLSCWFCLANPQVRPR
jgi:hypothetical protein